MRGGALAKVQESTARKLRLGRHEAAMADALLQVRVAGAGRLGLVGLLYSGSVTVHAQRPLCEGAIPSQHCTLLLVSVRSIACRP